MDKRNDSNEKKVGNDETLNKNNIDNKITNGYLKLLRTNRII